MMPSELQTRITAEPGKMGGKPCIRGHRFSVYDLMGYLAAGMSEEDIISEFPFLERDDFKAVYEYFALLPEKMSMV